MSFSCPPMKQVPMVSRESLFEWKRHLASHSQPHSLQVPLARCFPSHCPNTKTPSREPQQPGQLGQCNSCDTQELPLFPPFPHQETKAGIICLFVQLKNDSSL